MSGCGIAEHPAESVLPIREVTRQTGVHPVTLRAWERRYGLIKPIRSPKGHRLYSTAHIERIHSVLAWLERGVAVGQVKRLLNEAHFLACDDHWQGVQQACLACLPALDEAKLDERFNELSALYPAQTLYRQWLMPLLEQVSQQASYGSQQRLEKVFLQTWLRSKLSQRVQYNNRLHRTHPVLIVNWSQQVAALEPWLCAWLISQVGCAAQVLDAQVLPSELSAATQRIEARAVILCSAQVVEMTALYKALAACACPTLLCGDAVRIHAPQLNSCHQLTLAETPLQALECLQRFGWVDYLEGEALCTS